MDTFRLNGATHPRSGHLEGRLQDTPPQLAADLIDRGICLTGGGSLIQGMDERLRKETHLPVFRAEDPQTAVVRGTALLLENIPLLRRIQILD